MSNSFRGNEQVASKSQNGRKRKCPSSSSGPANSSGTANTVGPSLNSPPSTPCNQTSGDMMNMAGNLQHSGSSSNPLTMYASEGQGKVASPSNPLIVEPLKAMIMGAPLEDARNLAQRYERMQQEAEQQVAEITKCQSRVREAYAHSENAIRLQTVEAKLQELKANIAILGKEAIAAMGAVESQRQRITLQRLIAMVEAESAYHRRVAQILDEVQAKAELL